MEPLKPYEPWNKFLWGIAFADEHIADKGVLMGKSYNDYTAAPSYPGEPTEPLLFNTREQARNWKRAKLDEWFKHQDMKSWRLKIVRVYRQYTIRPNAKS